MVTGYTTHLRGRELRGRINEPLDADGQLYGDCEKQQQRLVRGGQVDAAVEADQEHAFDEQRAEHHRVPEPGAQSDRGAGQHGRLRAHKPADRRAQEQPAQQRLSQEQVSPAWFRFPRLAQHEHLRNVRGCRLRGRLNGLAVINGRGWETIYSPFETEHVFSIFEKPRSFCRLAFSLSTSVLSKIVANKRKPNLKKWLGKRIAR